MKIKQRLKLACSMCLLFGFTTLYPFLLYTDNAFIAEWRTIYIETAMSTMTHQYLATAIMPDSIITETMEVREQITADQADVQSQWSVTEITAMDRAEQVVDEKEWFYTLFEELDQETMEAYFEKNPEAIENGYAAVNIDECDSSSDTGIYTTAGDHVMAVNAVEGILILEVKDTIYNGRLALVKDASRVSIGLAQYVFTGAGMRLDDLAEYNGAILAINASGFIDPDGVGDGGDPYGYLKVGGEELQGAFGGGYKILGFDADNQLQIGVSSDTDIFVDAVEFGPALIVDGEDMLAYASTGFGNQPRTAIAQSADKTVMFLVIDGRQTHSLGASIVDCKEIFERYGAVQAINLDGGSSSIMYYNGRSITKASTASGNTLGRQLPNCFMVT